VAKRLIFIGYDDRESRAYEVCQYSLKEQSQAKLDIFPLNHKDLRDKGYFNREWKIDATGQYIDLKDGRPFSTQFSHTRFLVPEIARFKGRNEGIVMFVDLDFVFLQDVTELFKEAERALRDKPVAVVKHDYTPLRAVKMDGMQQHPYKRKLWSSLMMFNLSHPDVKALTKDKVNELPGSYFHQFEWVTGGDANIGSLNERWNFIPEHSELNVPLYDIGALHFTEGMPFMIGYENCAHSDIYYEMEENLKYDEFLRASKNIALFPRK
jgi:hypothetical protein